MTTSPVHPADDEARAIARTLLDRADHAALGVLLDGAPFVSRIAFACDGQGRPISLVSRLSVHTRALEEDPAASLLVGEPGPKGDPLTHPRLTLQAGALLVDREDAAHAGLRDLYLARHPKAKLYIDFSDFRFVRFDVSAAFLNAGFGRAYDLGPGDLRC